VFLIEENEKTKRFFHPIGIVRSANWNDPLKKNDEMNDSQHDGVQANQGPKPTVRVDMAEAFLA